MRNISEEEARALLSETTCCECDRDWAPLGTQFGASSMDIGLVDADGVGTQMQVNLCFRRGHKTGIVRYVFTVFKRQVYGKDRVYQLDVTHSRRPLKNAHKKSHEHMGNVRMLGDATWETWTFDDVLAHFCAKANVVMEPKPSHPEHFQLKGDI
jgi:hypothetical protein